MEKQPFEDVSPIKQLDNGPCPSQESKVWRYQEAWKTPPSYPVWDLFLLNLLKSQPLSNSEVLRKAPLNTNVLYRFLSGKKKQSPLRPVRIILGEALKVSGHISISSLPWFRHIYTSSQWNQQIPCFLQPKTIFPCHWLRFNFRFFGAAKFKKKSRKQHVPALFDPTPSRSNRRVPFDHKLRPECNNRSWTSQKKMESSTHQILQVWVSCSIWLNFHRPEMYVLRIVFLSYLLGVSGRVSLL